METIFNKPLDTEVAANTQAIWTLNTQIEVSSITAERNTTYISGFSYTARVSGNMVIFSGYFTVQAEIPINTTFITLGKQNKMGATVFSIICKTDNSIIRNIYLANNSAEIKANGSSIPTGEYAINFTYFTSD